MVTPPSPSDNDGATGARLRARERARRGTTNEEAAGGPISLGAGASFGHGCGGKTEKDGSAKTKAPAASSKGRNKTNATSRRRPRSEGAGASEEGGGDGKKKRVAVASPSSPEQDGGGNGGDQPDNVDLASSSELFEAWLNHHHHHHQGGEADGDGGNNGGGTDFHRFYDEEAGRIRWALLEWYDKSGERRRLPWRGDPPPWNSRLAGSASADDREGEAGVPSEHEAADACASSAFSVTPYGIWVSEVMLQQTRVETVINYWLRWMKAFPTVQVLAAASSEQINQLWAGLGYYSRARNLHRAAQGIVDELGGVFPTTSGELMKLPGVGRYTAGAVASIAFGECVPAVDGNVCRVLSRLRAIACPIQGPSSQSFREKHAYSLALQILQAGDATRPGCVNQALMEVGATYCSPSGTGIHPADPLRSFYYSTKIGLGALSMYFSLQGDKIQPAALMSQRSRPLFSSGGCKACAERGVDRVVEAICSALQAEAEQGSRGLQSDPDVSFLYRRAQTIGHRAFPLPPEPKTRREEAYAVAAISLVWPEEDPEEDGSSSGQHSTSRTRTRTRRWLMVQRPSRGLLASQWEFPSALVWLSDGDGAERNNKRMKNKSASVPKISAAVRAKALDRLLRELSIGDCEEADESSSSGAQERPLAAVRLDQVPRRPAVLSGSGEVSPSAPPLEHVFSHVRHTLWVELGSLTYTSDWFNRLEWRTDPVGGGDRDCLRRRVRWMTARELEEEVGATACVRQILNLVEPLQHCSEEPPSALSSTAAPRAGPNPSAKQTRRRGTEGRRAASAHDSTGSAGSDVASAAPDDASIGGTSNGKRRDVVRQGSKPRRETNKKPPLQKRTTVSDTRSRNLSVGINKPSV
jgi:A/G-specific adenine glycosylase